MNTVKESSVVKLPSINKEIMEMKKKIQLSEGQRKSLFAECEKQRKENTDKIIDLKKNISQLVVRLKDKRDTGLKTRLKTETTHLERVIGYLGDKTCGQVIEVLDLQVIDIMKVLDLLKYQAQKKEQYLAQLGDEYQQLLTGKVEKELIMKVDRPLKKKTKHLENQINAVEVQYREALHVKNRYDVIKKSLVEDTAKYESCIRKIQEEIRKQNLEIVKLQKTNLEAVKLRTAARNQLIHEERTTLATAATRGHQADECRQMVSNRRQQLEDLERRLFHGSRQAGAGGAEPRPGQDVEETEDDVTNDDTGDNEDDDTSSEHAMQELVEAFEVLKTATGGTDVDHVLERFKSQQETISRLALMRNNCETKKKEMEAQLDEYNMELQKMKIAAEKEAEHQVEEIETINRQIQTEVERKEQLDKATKLNKEVFQETVDKLDSIYMSLDPKGKSDRTWEELLQLLNAELDKYLEFAKTENQEEEEREHREGEEELQEDKWLPQPYVGLIRRTPIPQQGPSASTTPIPHPASVSDEDEVPSRGFLKRQAQMVIDAKSRRKAMKLPTRK